MKLKPDFKVVNIADDYMLVPVDNQVEQFNGVIVLNEVSAFILENLRTDTTKEALALLLTKDFDVDLTTAQADVNDVIEKLKDIGVIYE